MPSALTPPRNRAHQELSISAAGILEGRILGSWATICTWTPRHQNRTWIYCVPVAGQPDSGVYMDLASQVTLGCHRMEEKPFCWGKVDGEASERDWDQDGWCVVALRPGGQLGAGLYSCFFPPSWCDQTERSPQRLGLTQESLRTGMFLGYLGTRHVALGSH